MAQDPVANALTSIKNSENAAKKHCEFRPASKLMAEILRVMKEHGYIQEFERVEDDKNGHFRITLAGKINQCKAIKPRYAVAKGDYEKFEKRYLPSRDLGLIIVSTSKGVKSHQNAKEEGIGGRLLAFVY